VGYVKLEKYGVPISKVIRIALKEEGGRRSKGGPRQGLGDSEEDTL